MPGVTLFGYIQLQYAKSQDKFYIRRCQIAHAHTTGCVAGCGHRKIPDHGSSKTAGSALARLSGGISTMKNKICIALDVDSFDEAKKLVTALKEHVGYFKVGKQLFTRLGPQIVEYIQGQGAKVFLDLKFHDIPNTVRSASRAVADLGVTMFTIHTMGGFEMMRDAVQGVKDAGKTTKILGVTILTSINQDILRDDLNLKVPLGEQVLHLAKLAQMAG